MATNSKSLMEYETGVTPFLMSALADSGDHTLFDSSADLFSETDGNSPDVRPDGVLTGGVVSAAVSGSPDVVDVAALTCYLAGALTAVSAGLDESITRPATAVSKVNSITINSGGAITVVAGTDGTDANFTETRGAAGGPPYVPVGSIEIAQVRVASNTAAPITAAQIFQTVGTHREKSDYPSLTLLNDSGQVEFASALPAIHTADVPRGVYASYAEPVFAEQKFSNDFKPAEVSHSVSSEQVYGDTVGSSSESLGQGSFTAVLKDGITDDILSKKNQTLWFRYYQDRNKTPHILTQGKLGISRTFGAADQPKVTCTISASSASVERSA